MKSVKPGRGPSAMGALGAPIFFPIFGVLFIIIGIVQAVYHFKNATGENRYSAFDIVDSAEEPDPLDRRFAPDRDPEERLDESGDFRVCPYCGARLGSGFTFCGKCGKRLPEEP